MVTCQSPRSEFRAEFRLEGFNGPSEFWNLETLSEVVRGNAAELGAEGGPAAQNFERFASSLKPALEHRPAFGPEYLVINEFHPNSRGEAKLSKLSVYDVYAYGLDIRRDELMIQSDFTVYEGREARRTVFDPIAYEDGFSKKRKTVTFPEADIPFQVVFTDYFKNSRLPEKRSIECKALASARSVSLAIEKNAANFMNSKFSINRDGKNLVSSTYEGSVSEFDTWVGMIDRDIRLPVLQQNVGIEFEIATNCATLALENLPGSSLSLSIAKVTSQMFGALPPPPVGQ